MSTLLALALYNAIISFLLTFGWGVMEIVDELMERESEGVRVLKVVFQIGAMLFGGVAFILTLLEALI